MSKYKLTIEEKTLNKNWEKYRGHTVLVVDKDIYSVKNRLSAKKKFDMIRKKYNKIPLVAVIPKADTLILICL